MEIREIDQRIAAIEAELASRGEDYQGVSPDELQEQKYRAAAEVAMEYDPDQARAWFAAADQLAAKRDARQMDLLEMSNDIANEKDPETIRFKLVSNLNAINARLAQTPANDPTRPGLIELSNRIANELRQETPSVRRAYGYSPTGDQPDIVDDKTTQEDVDTVVSTDTDNDIVDGTKLDSTGLVLRSGAISGTPTDYFKMVEVDGAMKPVWREGVQPENVTGYPKEEYNKQMAQWRRSNDTAKAAAAEVANDPDRIISEVYKENKDLFKPMKGNFTKFAAGKEYINQEAYLAAIAAFTKVVMGEAVNEADIQNQLKEGKVDPNVAQLFNKIGWDPDKKNYITAAKGAERAAAEAIGTDLISLKNTGDLVGNKDLQTLFAKKYLGVEDLDALLKPSGDTKPKKESSNEIMKKLVAGPKPKREDYKTLREYAKALADYKSKGGK